MTFTITRLSLCPSNSAKKIRCHVPKSSLPPVGKEVLDVARAGLKTSGGDCAARKGQTAPDPARAAQRRWRPKRSSRADRRSSASRGTKHKRKSNNDVD